MQIQVSGLVCRYGNTLAVAGVDLEVREGEFLALLGPSGSGKTTLLRVLAGLEQPESGSVRLNGRDALAIPPNKRGVGFVFQHYALFRHMSVARNIGFGLAIQPRASRPTQAEIDRRVQELLDLVQLPDLGGRYPQQLSGGQRQRVALARALAIEPRLLLLDEPFGALDAKVRAELRVWLKALHRRLGVTSVFVTHDQDEAMELADRVVVMQQGRIRQIGPPAEVYADPASAFVYGFLGTANSIPGVIRDGQALAGDDQVLGDGITLPDGPAGLWFRPYQVELSPADGPALDGIVLDIVAIGPRARVTFTHRGATLTAELASTSESLTALKIDGPLRWRPREVRAYPKG